MAQCSRTAFHGRFFSTPSSQFYFTDLVLSGGYYSSGKI